MYKKCEQGPSHKTHYKGTFNLKPIKDVRQGTSQVTTAVFYIAHPFVKKRRKKRKADPRVHLKERTMAVLEIQDTTPQQEAVFVVVDRLPDADQ
ncbi:hypothetical protein SUGI_0548560 [Cryptomeria japonica]|nr:hypothetical protein SUGI_0548560 [Cryptomeria japonica]